MNSALSNLLNPCIANTRPHSRLEIKICGLTTAADAQAALDAGADFLGFVLYEHSPRAVTPAQLARIAAQLPASAKLVGVCVNLAARKIAQIALDCGLYAVQLHGDETASDYAELTIPLWRAFRICDNAPQPDPADWQTAERFILDATPPRNTDNYGGTGRQADWTLAANWARSLPLMLAGGLTPQNVATAIRMVKPLGLDVSGGVEQMPGKKDATQMQKFVRLARNVTLNYCS